MTDAGYDYILDEIKRHEKLGLKVMWVLIVMMTCIDDNNNNVIFNAVLRYIIIKNEYVNIIWIFICFFLNLGAYLIVSCLFFF